MEEVGRGLLFAFLLIALLAFIVVAIVAQSGRIAREKERYRTLAQRLGGQFVVENFFEPYSIAFPHGGTSGIVDTYSTGGDSPTHYTRVRIAWPGGRVRCEVFPAQTIHRLGRLLGMVDLEIGVPEFDHDFIIHGDDAERIRKLLTPEVRRIINGVRSQAEFGDVYFSLSRGELLLRRRGLYESNAEMEKFVRAATSLYDEISGEGAKGIRFLDDVRISESGGVPTATCQICGEAIAADPVLCNACRTPHHHDCWEYYGQCSTFGCRERGFHRPRRQAAAKGRK